jgi:ATP-binding cassette, subfamily F, member 3
MLLAPDTPSERPREAEAGRSAPAATRIWRSCAPTCACEQRLEKLEEMRDKLAAKLADPELYDDGRRGELEVWNRKYAEVMEGLDRAEALWMRAPRRWRRRESDTGWGAAAMPDPAFLVTVFVTLFVVIDPIGLAPCSSR